MEFIAEHANPASNAHYTYSEMSNHEHIKRFRDEETHLIVGADADLILLGKLISYLFLESSLIIYIHCFTRACVDAPKCFYLYKRRLQKR